MKSQLITRLIYRLSLRASHDLFASEWILILNLTFSISLQQEEESTHHRHVSEKAFLYGLGIQQEQVRHPSSFVDILIDSNNFQDMIW